jgi:hypothetical protein
VVAQQSGGRGRQISEFEAILVYKVSSRTARAIQRNPCLKKLGGGEEEEEISRRLIIEQITPLWK